MIKNLSFFVALGLLAKICFSQGSVYCTSNINTTGAVATISLQVNGTNGLAVLNNAPSNVTAQLICGISPMSNPFGNGMFCINPLAPIVRIGTISQTSQNGSANVLFNFSQLPSAPIHYFQWVYRDPTATGYTYNTSEAILY